MSPEQWNRMIELFHAAREKTQEERVALLDSIGSDDPALRLAIEQMLKDDEASCSLLDRPRIEDLGAPTVQSTPTSAGARFGRYEVIAPIGRGGMGEIWAARDTELHRNVALKFLALKPGFGRLAEHLTHEARAASALNHPNIVTVHEVIRHDDTPIIVMELVEGQALRALSGARQPVEQVVQIGLQAARALAAAHANGIVHCDIKPENILVRRDGYVKVLDFGLACKIENPDANASLAGTLRYMSPEQARGESLSSASDVFSLGLVLYELATGRHPFAGKAPLQAMRSIVTENLIPPSSIHPALPERLNSLIVAMLAKDPRLRPSAEEVARTLNEIQRLLDQSVAAQSAKSAGRKWIALGLLIMMCAGAVWFWKHHQVAKQPAFYQVTTLVPENRATAAAISPDGKRAAYANVDGIFVRNVQSGETTALLSPSEYVADSLAWFADGKGLVASGFSALTNVPGIWFISSMGAAPRLLRTAGREATPSPDGKHIAFTAGDQSQIWVMGANGEQPRQVIAGHANETFGSVFWSPDGRRLGVQDRLYTSGRDTWGVGMERFYEKNYKSIDLATGRVLASVKNLPLNSASWLPGDRLIFLGWDLSAGDFVERLWQVKTDARTGAFLASPRQIANPVTEPETHITDISATRDGKLVMVLKQSNQNAVFTGEFDRTPPRITNIRRLTLDERTSYPHAWTRDNREVIFESIRRGNWDIFRQNIDQRTAESIVATPLMEVLPQVGPDSHWVLYACGNLAHTESKLMRVPVDGGTPEEIPIGGPLDEFHCALGLGKRCALRVSLRDQYRAFYDLDPIRGKGRELARIQWFPEALGDWDVSPDGKYVAVSEHHPREARILLVALEPRPNEAHEREIVLPGFAELNDVIWSADGQGWFVSVNTSIGNRLLYFYLDGRFRSLGDIQGWAVPSPDGRRVAFLDRIVATNAWMIDRR